MSRSSYAVKSGLALCIATLALLAAASTAAAYELDPNLSLTGDCFTAAVDPVFDPGCPGGEHPGRFNGPKAVAIDPYGNEYVANAPEVDTGWIDVFDDEGKFVTHLAGVSNPKSIAVDSEANLYVFTSPGELLRYGPTAASQPKLGIVKYEAAPVLVGSGGSVGAVVVDAANDELLVARLGVVTRYKSAAEGNGEVATGESGGTWSEALAIDSQRRRLYVSYCANVTTECGVKVLDADTFTEIKTSNTPIDGSTTPAGKFITGLGWLPIAVDEESGEVCIGDINQAKTVYCYSAAYDYLSKTSSPAFEANSSLQIAISNGEPEPGVDAFNRHFLFVPVFPAGNRVLAFQPPDVNPPTIKSISVEGIGETEAELGATIMPNGAETTYRFEYTTEQKFEAEGFTGATLAGEGTIAETTFEADVSTQISGLSPGTAYRFRVVARNESESVVGEAEAEGSFATYQDATSALTCPNQALRVGASAQLPDCRAYELVTPPETNGREPKGLAAQGDTFTTVQAAPGGEAVTFRIEGGSLPGTTGNGGFNGDPYLSARTSTGWTTELAGPSGGEATVTIPGAVSPDQGYSFWVGREEGSAVIDEGETRYVRYPDGHSELIGRGSLDTDPRAGGQFIAENGTDIVFSGTQQLEPDAPPTGTRAVYDRTPDEATHVVSLLPGDVTPDPGQNAKYLGASPDGAGIAFEIDGTLYLRKGNATTYAIGTGVTFAGVSEGGERVFYLQGGDLLAYDTSEDETIEFSTTGDVTPVNVASGGTRAAFVSPSVLGGENPEGAVAQAGKENLYLSTEGQIAFVATVTERDVEGEEFSGANQADGLGLWLKVAGRQAASDPSRLNPSGSVLLFQSRANLTGYDPDGSPQVYRYDTDAERLHCLSCIPTGAAASGGGALQSYSFNSLNSALFAPVVRVPNLTPSGDRVFFESTEALVSGDTDGVRDVYEWEEDGVGGCTRAGGCTYLVSSGHSERDNFLYGHSQSGDDVFFTTGDILTGFDGGGTVSIYDARVGGGFAEPESEICQGEGCRPSLSPPPSTVSPARPTLGADDNVPQGKKPKHCPKNKRKVKKNGKARCVAKHKPKHHHKKAGSKRRAGK